MTFQALKRIGLPILLGALGFILMAGIWQVYTNHMTLQAVVLGLSNTATWARQVEGRLQALEGKKPEPEKKPDPVKPEKKEK